MSYEVKAATFNANIVIGKGDTREAAYDAVTKAAADLGSCIRKVIDERECIANYAEGKKVFTWKFPV